MFKRKFYKFLKFLLVPTIFLGIICYNPIIVHASIYYEDFGTPVMQEEVDDVKTETSELTNIPSELKTKVSQDVDYVKEGRLTRSAYHTVKNIFLKIKYYDSLLDSANNLYTIYNTAEAFINQHNPNHADYIDGAKTWTSTGLTQANAELASMEAEVIDNENSTYSLADGDGRVPVAINNINSGLTELQNLDLQDTSAGHLSYIRQTAREQDSLYIDEATDYMITAKTNLKTDLQDLIQIAENNLVSAN